MLLGFFGTLIIAIIARMLCGNHLNFSHCIKVGGTPSSMQLIITIYHHTEDMIFQDIFLLSRQQHFNLSVHDENIFGSSSVVIGNLRKMFANVREMFRNVPFAFGRILENLRKIVKNVVISMFT